MLTAGASAEVNGSIALGLAICYFVLLDLDDGDTPETAI